MAQSRSHIGPRLRHTGTEPKTALSAYGLRLALALGGLVVFAAIALWVLLTPGMTAAASVLGVVAAAIALLAAVDVVMIVRGMRHEHPVDPRHRS
ncbi:hypothetical protein FE697_017210 [Mumia zhuanghuii]|uniref:DUF6343 family protein n=2 Tax=Mumia TaxID=1546255 RepID=A0ABW1QMJ2_9ACTN|nr:MULTISPECIES: DUF6343 family protein [Mumia]KAA1420681.1 hypothetical protein FE697_017210 [Mumia zhuanghuii]